VPRPAARRFGLIATIAGVSIITSFLLELVADKVDAPGLKSFVSYTHGGS
jgi:hypothetical protein